MNMLDGLSDIGGNALAKVLRRTVISSLIVGAAGVIIVLFLGSFWAALGIVIGLGMAILNLRFLDAGVAKLKTDGEENNKILRRAIGTKSVTRLGIITLIAVGLLIIDGPLGIGAVAGLVIFQILFVINVSRVLMTQGLQ
jgi:hypothetical protein